MPKTNLRWEVKKLQRAGHSSSRITKQVQHRLKRAHAGKLHPGRSSDKIQSLAEEAVRKQRYHLTKQLHQAMKKAKSFLLRKLMRRGKEGSKAEGGGKAEGGAEAEERLRVLRALPVQEVARTALSSLGLEDDGGHAHKDDQAALQEWRPLQVRLPALCERTERQLLAAAAVVLPMATLTLTLSLAPTLTLTLTPNLNPSPSPSPSTSPSPSPSPSPNPSSRNPNPDPNQDTDLPTRALIDHLGGLGLRLALGSPRTSNHDPNPNPTPNSEPSPSLNPSPAPTPHPTPTPTPNQMGWASTRRSCTCCANRRLGLGLGLGLGVRVSVRASGF